MLINEVSKMTGFSKDTIRYYEKIGLIELNRSTGSRANYRYFGKREVEKLRQIKLLKEFGFTLKEIKYLVRLSDTDMAKCNTLSDVVDKKVSAIDEKLDELNVMRSRLVRARNSCVGDCAEFVSLEN